MRSLTAVLIAAVITAGGVTAAAEPSGAADASLRYVALGDSYSAASGNVPVDASSPQCIRSTINYPHLIAAAIHAQFTDVTCGAAETKDFTTSQYPGVAPQLDAVHANTQLVTMTIGGNDSGVFIDSILDCGAAGATTLGQGHPCQDEYGSSFVDTIRTTTYPALVKALNAVRAKAPHARVAILSYPWIVPTSGGCYPQMPVASGDIPYLRNEQSVLNEAVRRAAAATGSIYVDLNTVSNGHDACKAIGTRWIEPVLLGTNPVIVHPNALGESKMAAQAMKVLHLG